MSETSEIIKEYLFAFQNRFYSLALEKAFAFFKEVLYKISEINHDTLIDILGFDKYNKDILKDILILYSEFYQKRYLVNLYNIRTNDFGLFFIIYFLHYLNQNENSVLKTAFAKEILQNSRSEFFEEIYNLLNYIEKSIDYQNDTAKIYFTNEYKFRTINGIIESIKEFLDNNPKTELNNMIFIFVECFNLFNRLFLDKMFSINEIIQVLMLFQREEWMNSLNSIFISPNEDYDINAEELKVFIRLYWVYFTLNNFKKHLKIFTTDYFYHKKSENKRISKAEEIAQSHYLLYLRQFLDKGNDEHKIVDHEKHFGNSRYDILIDAFEGFPPFIIECKFAVENITKNKLSDWIAQILNYIEQYNNSYNTVKINSGLLLVFHNAKSNLENIDILESINNSFYKIQNSSKNIEADLYLYSINID